MPGLQLTLNAASVSAGNLLIPALPTFPTPIIWAYFGGSLAASQNMPVGSAALANINAGPNYPVGASSIYGAGYATFTPNGTAGSQLALQGPNDAGGSLTMISVFRTPAVTGVQVILGSEGTDGKGSVLYAQPSTSQLIGQIKGSAGAPTLTIPQGMSAFMMAAMVHTDGAATDTIYDLTHGLQSATSGSTSPRNISVTPAWTIGTGTAQIAGQAQTSDIAFMALFNSALSLVTLQAIYASVKASLGLRGITT